ncbi:MAG: phosphoribosylamine--glycine ligase, partial [Myxococcales bacterium]|nr:phosphoribosylamine--glycine ligase [Myxococcales bacterium]
RAAVARAARADLVVVGPEAPLCAGTVDALAADGIAAFGPSRAAAALEGSKVFLKRFVERHKIPTAAFLATSDFAEAERYIRGRGRDVVVKADGLCAGKGVVVPSSPDEACAAAHAMLVERRFGDAGASIVIEDRLAGVELSVHAICDGERLFVLPVARDHKRVGDGDRGPNTGGMGAVAPVAVDAALTERIATRVLAPTLAGMRQEGRPFRGVLFAGLMVDAAGEPWLLEHNVRFGDPETQALLALCEGDLAELLAGAARGALDPSAVRVVPGRCSVALVLASRGYPERPETGAPIEGLEAAAAIPETTVLHAGTAEEDGRIVTSGGRVLTVTSTAESPAEARARAYRAAECIRFEGMHYRRDIGADWQTPAH